MRVDRGLFFQLQRNMEIVPFSQSQGWNEFQSRSNTVIDYFVDSETSPMIAVWGRRFRIPLFGGTILKIDGESFNGAPSRQQITDFYDNVYQCGYSMVLLSSIASPNVDYEIGIRKAGFVRPLGNSACPLSILVNILNPEKRSRLWKRSISKAEKSLLTFSFIESPTETDCEVFASLNTEMVQLKSLGNKHLIETHILQKLFLTKDYRLYFVKTPDGVCVSGRVVYVRNCYAEDVLAANSKLARDCGASYYILENIFNDLKSLGVTDFDFSRIAPGLGSANSVGDFKMYSGGKPIQYSGEWVRAKSKYTELFYLLYRYYYKQGARY